MFEGAYTAIVTPFDRSRRVDYGKFKELIELQIAGGIDGIVPVGTTGESPTLDVDEHKKVIETAIAKAGQTIKNMRWFEVVETRGHIENGKVAHWQVTIKVGFTVED